MHNRAIKLSKHLIPLFETPSIEYSEWFGYYNYDPLNYDQTKMLCGRSTYEGVAPTKGMTIEVGYYDIPSGVWHQIGTSDSWNWQQGAMLQWIPEGGVESCIIYNTSRNNQLISIIHNIKTGEDRQLDWPIYGITPDGKKSIALDLERSYWCRAYHYQSVANSEKEGRVYEGDGIYEIDLLENTRKRIISIQSIIEFDSSPDFIDKKHWIEHIMISPSGKRFCFLHRYSSVNNVMDYGTRLFVADIDGGNLQVVSGWKKYIWSHFGWNDDDSFAIYTVEAGRFQELKGLKEILNMRPLPYWELVKRVFYNASIKLPYPLDQFLSGRKSYYQYYKVNQQGKFELSKRIANRFFSIDGHPSFIRNNHTMLTDSYPTRKAYQRLLSYDINTDKTTLLGEFYAALRNTPASCDLHPKLSRNNILVVDTAYDGRHHMIVFKMV